LTRYPGVNLVLSHGGGALPFALGRIMRNYENHRDYAEPLAEFRRLYFDTVLFEPRALRFLCDVAGAKKVMLGSDHPFPIGDDEPVKIVDKTPLGPAERQAILTASDAFALLALTFALIGIRACYGPFFSLPAAFLGGPAASP
jgi:aminocarboxymuconate-semialdehyde decarboxylase